MNSNSIGCVIALLLYTSLQATEPNETFETATVLSPGVLSVSDALAPQVFNFPDTLLGIRNALGMITQTDNDGSPIGNGTASGLAGVPTNSGSIDFSVTGEGDTSFAGAHSELGGYEVFVDAYNRFGDLVDSFSRVRTLQPGIAHEFSFLDFEWLGGSYDVYIDNTIDITPADVDFFTFTGLEPGKQFTARTLDPTAPQIDTYLGWFDSMGTIVDTDENSGGGFLSLIEGTVPANGLLTFAVTGFGDNNFAGVHSEEGSYELRLGLEGVALAGDYNANQVVDAADYVVWRDTLGQTGTGLPADGNNNERIDSGDYDLWRSRFGDGAVSSATLYSVPEPRSYVLVTISSWAWFRLFSATARGQLRVALASEV